MFRLAALKLAIFGVLVTTSSASLALGDQWYLGIGGGTSRLQPNPTDTTIDLDEEFGTAGVLTLGLDIDRRSSGQITLYSLGEATFDNGQSADYIAGDASLLYRFFDTRDYSRRGKIFGASVYGRFGFGFIERDAELSLRNDTPVYFGAGGGIETYLTHNLGVRFEALFHETDTASATVSLIGRFGGQQVRRAQRPSSTAPIELEARPDTGAAPTVTTAPIQRSEATPADQQKALPEVYVPPAGTPIPRSTANANRNNEAATSPSVESPDTQPTTADGQNIDLKEILTTTAPAVPTDRPAPVVPAPSAPIATNVLPTETESVTEDDALFEVELMADESTETLTDPATTASPTDTAVPTAEPAVVQRVADADQDNIPDSRDSCLQSTPGYPVNNSGCPVFNGRWLDVIFVGQTADLMASAYPSLDELARVMRQFPVMRLELAAHTDNSGTSQEQANRTRQRLRTVGLYLVDQGISANRLVLRSYGGSRPAYSNDNALGRRENNRIEIFERP